MTDSYNRDEVVAFWRSTGLENKHKRREIEKLAQLTGAHVDHIKPLRAGGLDLWFNLQVLSGTRNTSKGANFPEIDQREYEKRWTALPEDYKVAVQAAIDGNPQPVTNFFKKAAQRVTKRRKKTKAERSWDSWRKWQLEEFNSLPQEQKEDYLNKHRNIARKNDRTLGRLGKFFLLNLVTAILLGLSGSEYAKWPTAALVLALPTFGVATGGADKSRKFLQAYDHINSTHYSSEP